MKSKHSVLVLKDVNLIDCYNDTIQHNMVVVVKDGKIEKIGNEKDINFDEESIILSLSGKTLIPGLIDAHVHLFQSGVDDFLKPYSERLLTKFKRNCALTINSGVTTVRNMPGGSKKIFKYRKLVNKGSIIGPRILASGPAISVPYSYFSKKSYLPFTGVLGYLLERMFKITGLSIDVQNKDEVKNTVKIIKDQGADFIKTITPESTYPYASEEQMRRELLDKGVKEEVIEASMDIKILKAIVNEAQKLDLKVVCHNVFGVKGFSEAVEAGVDSIEHCPIGIIPEEVLECMSKNHISWVPTAYAFTNWKNIIDNPDLYDSKEYTSRISKPYHEFGKKCLEQVRNDIKADGLWGKFYKDVVLNEQKYFKTNLMNALKYRVKIVAGVDCGAGGAGYVPHGLLHKELELYVEKGMTEIEAIKTATVNASQLIGKSDELGTIEIGKVGDLVVLNGNPLEDITYLRDIHYVIKNGKVVFESEAV